ncbi:hypothetical protein [Stygiolobus caldivivus]|uniref:Uncharacterized protein n=1 Tax=Stygiolobus caldivivus TaxID=2824673 RepID=A0A8D5U5C7_9CREN|nr:hypothetical protein [Stygiolobus caldivivus]BCU69588.1 hypothetical protein KN1_08850 [Stygiolobus caldivivus]
MLVKVVSGLIGGTVEVIFFVNDLEVFSYISQRILHIDLIVTGLALHMVASALVFLVGSLLVEKTGISPNGVLSSLVLGIMFGSSVLALFSIPIHLLIFHFTLTLGYVFAHIAYGTVSYLVYWVLKLKY